MASLVLPLMITTILLGLSLSFFSRLSTPADGFESAWRLCTKETLLPQTMG